MIQIPNYTFKHTLGQGGMATVWLAEHNTLRKPVAIKVLNKEFVHNENIRKRFLSEARNLFGMSHPNIIKVTDMIDQDDMVAFVMEYMEGHTLKDYLDANGKLPDEEIQQLFIQMLDAVGYVHEQGLIHRDIKPSNFMISNKGVIKLLDFGIAKNTDINSAEYTMTGTSQNMGTPMYMSPEQVKSTKDVTSQSDIYSLGVVLWQMVMGRKPYDTNTISTFELQTKIVTVPLSLTNTHWDRIIQQATQKDTAKRYVSCKELFLELQGKINKKVKRKINEKNIDNDETIIENDTIVSTNIQIQNLNTLLSVLEENPNLFEDGLDQSLSCAAPIYTQKKKKNSVQFNSKNQNVMHLQNALTNNEELRKVYRKLKNLTFIKIFSTITLLGAFLWGIWITSTWKNISFGSEYYELSHERIQSAADSFAYISMITILLNLLCHVLVWDILERKNIFPKTVYVHFIIYIIMIIWSVAIIFYQHISIYDISFVWALYIITDFLIQRKALIKYKNILGFDSISK